MHYFLLFRFIKLAISDWLSHNCTDTAERVCCFHLNAVHMTFTEKLKNDIAHEIIPLDISQCHVKPSSPTPLLQPPLPEEHSSHWRHRHHRPHDGGLVFRRGRSRDCSKAHLRLRQDDVHGGPQDARFNRRRTMWSHKLPSANVVAP